jgi:hypothetical protein
MKPCTCEHDSDICDLWAHSSYHQLQTEQSNKERVRTGGLPTSPSSQVLSLPLPNSPSLSSLYFITWVHLCPVMWQAAPRLPALSCTHASLSMHQRGDSSPCFPQILEIAESHRNWIDAFAIDHSKSVINAHPLHSNTGLKHFSLKQQETKQIHWGSTWELRKGAVK